MLSDDECVNKCTVLIHYQRPTLRATNLRLRKTHERKLQITTLASTYTKEKHDEYEH